MKPKSHTVIAFKGQDCLEKSMHESEDRNAPSMKTASLEKCSHLMWTLGQAQCLLSSATKLSHKTPKAPQNKHMMRIRTSILPRDQVPNATAINNELLDWSNCTYTGDIDCNGTDTIPGECMTFVNRTSPDVN